MCWLLIVIKDPSTPLSLIECIGTAVILAQAGILKRLHYDSQSSWE